MHYVIFKAKWLRNRENDPNRPKHYREYSGGQLLNPDGLMCCLGFCALQKGASKTNIIGRLLPDDLDIFLPGLNRKVSQKYFSVKGFVNTELSGKAAVINDSKDKDFATDEQKIKALTKLFKKHKHTIEFVD